MQVAWQRREGIGYPELPPRVRDGAFEDVRRIGEEGAQAADGSELEGEAEAQVVGATPVDECLVLVVEVKLPRKLLRGGLAGVAVVRPSLIVGEEAHGHLSRPETGARAAAHQREIGVADRGHGGSAQRAATRVRSSHDPNATGV